jgi:hypothetical protein
VSLEVRRKDEGHYAHRLVWKDPLKCTFLVGALELVRNIYNDAKKQGYYIPPTTTVTVVEVPEPIVGVGVI